VVLVPGVTRKSMEPFLVGDPRLLEGCPPERMGFAWCDELPVAAWEDELGTGSVLARWPALDAPPLVVARPAGHVAELVIDPAGTRAAVIAAENRGDGGASVRRLDVIDLGTGAGRTLLATGGAVADLECPAWSPDGAALALPLRAEGGARVRVIDAVTGAPRAEAEIEAFVDAWTAGGLRLQSRRLDFERAVAVRRNFAWDPAAGGAPCDLGADARVFPSPDGRFELRVRDGALLVRGEGGERRFDGRPEDEEAIVLVADYDPGWVGPHHVALVDVVLDLETLEARPLSALPRASAYSTSPGFTVTLLRARAGRLWWGRPRLR
jgi:hypothetical protein